jgi:hypothetical protein
MARSARCTRLGPRAAARRAVSRPISEPPADGILIAGRGPVDAVVATSFPGHRAACAGARERRMGPDRRAGLAFHPSFAGVSRWPPHGAQPEALVLSRAGRRTCAAFRPALPTCECLSATEARG